MADMKLIKTSWKVIEPGGKDAKEFFGELPKEPGYDMLREILSPLFGGKGSNWEHVSVLADYSNGESYEQLDMFVDDMGLLKRLPRNEEATTMYRRANQLGMTAIPKLEDPEQLSYICGSAVLFSRRVWF